MRLTEGEASAIHRVADSLLGRQATPSEAPAVRKKGQSAPAEQVPALSPGGSGAVQGFEAGQCEWAQQFRRRRRPSIWFYGVACAGVLLPVILLTRGIGTYSVLSIGGGVMLVLVWLLTAFLARWYAIPICPSCGRDITTCRVLYCYGCGSLLSGGRCRGCGVDTSWTSALHPFGASECPIAYCPNCGAFLDTSFHRAGL